MFREIMLVADALRLGGAILMNHPQMLGPQLVGRLLPEMGSYPNVKKLLAQCDCEGLKHCALIPASHCFHTPGGPLKVLKSAFVSSQLQEVTEDVCMKQYFLCFCSCL